MIYGEKMKIQSFRMTAAISEYCFIIKSSETQKDFISKETEVLGCAVKS